MGFKADTSFLRFLSMGAAGARQVMEQMKAAGFEPIELERYCTSNKVWSTKVKRLRLPDLLCTRTGSRVEVRAKSDLKIRMSDAPTNPERRWNTGMRDEDLAAFITCFDNNGTPKPAAEAVFFSFGDLAATEAASKLGPPKSASEGAERDRTWSASIPQRNGVVDYVDADMIRVVMDADRERPARPQTYRLQGRVPYVAPGDRFVAEESIIAGAPSRRIDIRTYLQKKYDPLGSLAANDPVDRYAAVKALPFLPGRKREAVTRIEERLDVELEERVLLEAAGAGTKLESAKAWDCLRGFVWKQERADLRMEAVLILTELRSLGAGEVLLEIANDKNFADDEIRQAAVWGLGKTGLHQYSELIPFLNDNDRDVVLHAIVAFGSDTPKQVVDQLIGLLASGNNELAPAVSEALRLIGSDVVLKQLIAAVKSTEETNAWMLATLGRLPADRVSSALDGDELLSRITPLLLLSGPNNWLASDAFDIDLKFLIKQDL